MTGLWKIDTKSEWKQFLYKLYHIITEISYAFLLFTFIFHAYWVRHDVGKLSTNLCTTIVNFLYLTKSWISHYKMKQVENLRIKLENNLYLENIGKSDEDKEIIEKNSREVVFVTRMYFIMAELVCVLWFTFPVIGKSKERRLPVEFPPYPRIKETPFYELAYLQEVIAITVFSWLVVAYDTIFWGFASRICSQFEILAKNFNNLNDLYKDEENNGFYGIQQENYYDYFEMGSNMADRNKNNEKRRRLETERIIKENILHHKAILKYVQY